MSKYNCRWFALNSNDFNFIKMIKNIMNCNITRTKQVNALDWDNELINISKKHFRVT